jgi:eukaryotic-like serine/threonine-protein kinase
LREAHRQGFVHRDLKPSNIMLVPEDDESDIVKLIDFGIGKVVQARSSTTDLEEQDQTRVGLLLGSPRYMAPEQIRGEAVEPRTDLYGLGVILFQALTGRVPFEHSSDVETMLAHCSSPPPPLDAYVEEPTGSLPELLADLLQKRAEDRPTIHEFLARLANVEAELFDSVGLAGPTLFGNRPSTAPRASMGSIRPPPPPPRPTRAAVPFATEEVVPLFKSEPPTVVTTGIGVAAAAAPRGKKWVWVLLPILGILLWLGLRGEPARQAATPAPRASVSVFTDGAELGGRASRRDGARANAVERARGIRNEATPQARRRAARRHPRQARTGAHRRTTRYQLGALISFTSLWECLRAEILASFWSRGARGVAR